MESLGVKANDILSNKTSTASAKIKLFKNNKMKSIDIFNRIDSDALKNLNTLQENKLLNFRQKQSSTVTENVEASSNVISNTIPSVISNSFTKS